MAERRIKPLTEKEQQFQLDWLNHEIEVEFADSVHQHALGSLVLDLESLMHRALTAAYMTGYRDSLAQGLGQESKDQTRFARGLRERATALLTRKTRESTEGELETDLV